MTNNNPYEKLVDYFNSQNKKSTPSNKENKVKSEVKTKAKPSDALEKVKKDFISFVPDPEPEMPAIKSTSGFNIGSFEKLMRAKLIEEHKKLQSYERPYISVSELCSCIRQCYYTRNKYPIDAKKLFTYPYLYLIQKVGNTIHEILQELFNFSETEKTILSEIFKVKGRLDGIKDNILYEIKSIDADKFNNTYVQKHYIQGIIYAYILNTEYNYNIDTITIIYVLRSLKKIVPFDLPIDDEIAKKYLNNAYVLKNALDNHQVPDPVGATSEDCAFCIYKNHCQNDECTIPQPFNRKKKQKEEKAAEYKKPELPNKKSAFLL